VIRSACEGSTRGRISSGELQLTIADVQGEVLCVLTLTRSEAYRDRGQNVTRS